MTPATIAADTSRDIAAENTRAVLRAVRANRHLIMSTVNGDYRCSGCDTSRACEIDWCVSCNEFTASDFHGEPL